MQTSKIKDSLQQPEQRVHEAVALTVLRNKRVLMWTIGSSGCGLRVVLWARALPRGMLDCATKTVAESGANAATVFGHGHDKDINCGNNICSLPA